MPFNTQHSNITLLTLILPTYLSLHITIDCDPHPGNLACDAQEGGRLIFYDFGKKASSCFLFLLKGIFRVIQEIKIS